MEYNLRVADGINLRLPLCKVGDESQKLGLGRGGNVHSWMKVQKADMHISTMERKDGCAGLAAVLITVHRQAGVPY